MQNKCADVQVFDNQLIRWRCWMWNLKCKSGLTEGDVDNITSQIWCL